MIKLELVISNPTGIHARPAQALVKLCERFQSNIQLQCAKGCINPKSIFSLLGAAIKMGSQIELQIDGPDEEEAACCLADFFDRLID